MSAIQAFERRDYGHVVDSELHWYGSAEASVHDLDDLLSIRSDDDILAFLDSHAALCERGFRLQFRRPSQLEDEQKRGLMNDVKNVVNHMHVAYDLRELANRDGISLDNAPKYLNLEHHSDGHEIKGYGVYSDFHGVNAYGYVTCELELPDRDGVMPESGEEIQIGENEFLHIMTGVAAMPGDGPECVRSAISSALDELVSGYLSDVRLVARNHELTLQATSYLSYLWYVFANRLFGCDIRQCDACGRLFVANTNSKHERGGKPKKYCDAACRALAVKARKAEALINDGMPIEEASKAAHIRLEKLVKYLEIKSE